MNEREYNDLMKKALTSEVHWQAQIASDDGVEEIREWLTTAAKRVRSDLIVKQSEWGALKASCHPKTQRYRDGLRDYQAWRASAQRFTSMVEERLEQLQSRQRKQPAVVDVELTSCEEA